MSAERDWMKMEDAISRARCERDEAVAQVAKLEARVAELTRALRGVTSLVESLDEEYVKMPGTFGWVLQAREALASDGSTALEAVRLAQRFVRRLGGGSDVLAALTEAFGSAD